MIRLGLTGSIGMGKSTTAGLFRELDVPVYDADRAVHDIYRPGGSAVGPVSEAFSGILASDGGIDRARLREAVLGNGDALKQLEAIVHPLVAQTQLAFLEAADSQGQPFVVLDIPLLFETGGDRRCDHVLVVTAPAELQRQRVLERGEMDEAAFRAILDKQVPDAEKRARADFVINTGFGLEFARDQVRAISRLMIRLAGEPGND